MRFKNIFTQALFAVSAVSAQATAEEAAAAEAALEKAASQANTEGVGAATVPCDDISKYTVSWFQAFICKKPDPTSCLFYTRGLSKRAKQYAKADGNHQTTIWEIWGSELYDKRQITSNPLRCIMQDKAKRQIYFEHMSEAFVGLCNVYAEVMDKDINNVRMDGIWGRVEFPALVRGGGYYVNLIKALSEDGKRTAEFWRRPIVGRIARRQDDRGVANGADPGVVNGSEAAMTTYGTDDDTAASFDEDGDSPVDW